ncbi:MAG: ABC transporter ATP-binding protein [Paracoccaceae bacterium]|nr:ABC transporter ATP-binding protein [Paracoccaceae bacterium]
MTFTALLVENLSWGLPRSEPLLHPTCFHVEAGQMLAIVGANGAGKSTLLRLLYRFLRPTTGRILLNGKDIWTMNTRSAARSIAAVLQEQQNDFSLTVREIIALGRTPYQGGFGQNSRADTNIIDRVIEQLNLDVLAGRMFGTLSGGERQRVMIARALVQEPQVLILDEPTNHLDIRHQLEVLTLIRGLGPTIVTSLHDLNMAAEYTDALLVLSRGHTVACGPPKEVLTAPLIAKAFGVQAQVQSLYPSGQTRLTFHI